VTTSPLMRRLIRFAGASGGGLVIDYGIYTALCTIGLPAGVANLISAACGVTFVFIVSVHHVFEARDHFQWKLFVPYAVYQVVAVGLASLAVDLLTDAFDGKFLLGKTCVLPFTFTANYLFMAWLLRERKREGLDDEDPAAAAAEPELVR
jgi:putative flippase GtrA